MVPVCCATRHGTMGTRGRWLVTAEDTERKCRGRRGRRQPLDPEARKGDAGEGRRAETPESGCEERPRHWSEAHWGSAREGQSREGLRRLVLRNYRGLGGRLPPRRRRRDGNGRACLPENVLAARGSGAGLLNRLRFSTGPPPTSTEAKQVSRNNAYCVPDPDFFLFHSKKGHSLGFMNPERVVTCGLRSAAEALTGTLPVQA